MIILGIDHRSSSPQSRGKLAMPRSERLESLNSLKDRGVNEALVLSTCNRTEVLFSGEESIVQDFLNQRHQQDWLRFESENAVTRAFRWCAGLESAVLGETEIVAQVKEAWSESQQVGTMGPNLDLAIRHAFQAGKRVRNETHLCRGVVSYAVMAAREASARIGGYKGKRIVILGAGEMAERMIRELARTTPDQLIIASRSLERGQSLADRYAHVFPSITAQSVYARLPESDAIFGCLPVPFEGQPNSKILIDLGIPPVFTPESATIAMDTFIARAEQNSQFRQAAIIDAEAIIEVELAKYNSEITRRENWKRGATLG